MSYWLLGKVLAPFVLLLLAWCVTRPAARLVQRRMRASAAKTFLLLHSERDGWRYNVPAVVIIVGFYAALGWAAWR